MIFDLFSWYRNISQEGRPGAIAGTRSSSEGIRASQSQSSSNVDEERRRRLEDWMRDSVSFALKKEFSQLEEEYKLHQRLMEEMFANSRDAPTSWFNLLQRISSFLSTRLSMQGNHDPEPSSPGEEFKSRSQAIFTQLVEKFHRTKPVETNGDDWDADFRHMLETLGNTIAKEMDLKGFAYSGTDWRLSLEPNPEVVLHKMKDTRWDTRLFCLSDQDSLSATEVPPSQYPEATHIGLKVSGVSSGRRRQDLLLCTPTRNGCNAERTAQWKQVTESERTEG